MPEGPGDPTEEHLVDLPVFEPGTSISQALLQMRGLGKRAALVGTSEAPVGWVTLKDLVEELTGDLVGL
ncbi:MAG: CBS domain-containing protein [Planctomycetota bacterium]